MFRVNSLTVMILIMVFAIILLLLLGSHDERKEKRFTLGYKEQPCLPCPDTVRLWVRVDSTVFRDDGTAIHFSAPDTVYLDTLYVPLPKGRWVKMDRWNVYKSFFPDSLYRHTGEFRFSDNQIVPCPDSVFILQEE